MAANISPIFTESPAIQWGATALATANTAKDGTGTTLTVFTAGVDGSYVSRIRFRSAGTNIATVARIFINNGGSSATPANNILFDEVTLSATTLSETSALAQYEVALNFALPASYTIRVTVGTTVAAGYYISVVGGHY